MAQRTLKLAARMRWGIAISTGILLAIVAGIAVWPTTRDSARELPGPTSFDEAITPAQPVLRAPTVGSRAPTERSATLSDRGAAAAEDDVGDAPEVGFIRLSGTVLGPDGKQLVESGTVEILGSIGSRSFGIESAPLVGGWFTIDLRRSELSDARALDVWAVVEEFAATRASIALEQGTDAYVVETRLPPLHRMSGRIVDHEGSPIPALPVLLTTRSEDPYLSDLLRNRTVARLAAAPWSRFLDAFARTDEHGIFRLHAASTHGWSVLSRSPDWFVVPAPSSQTVDGMREWVAHPARTLAGSIVDDTTGAPVPNAHVRIGVGDGSGRYPNAYGFQVKDGRFSCAWAARPGEPVDPPILVSVTAQGYEANEVEARAPSLRREEPITVRLHALRVADPCRVEFAFADAVWESLELRSVHACLVNANNRDIWSPEELHPTGRRSFAGNVPSGTGELVVFTQDPRCFFVWSKSVSLAARGDVTLQCDLPPPSLVTIRTHMSTRSVDAAPKAHPRAVWKLEAGGGELQVLASAGEWRLAAHGGSRDRSTKRVVISPSRRTLVALER